MLKNWKTTLGGLLAGLPIAGEAVLQAFSEGTLTGKSGSQLLLGIGIIVLGAYSKDHNMTGGTVSQYEGTTQPATKQDVFPLQK